MPVDSQIALQARGPQIENPLNYLLQAQQMQAAQNQNAMFPMMQQEQNLKLIQAQRMNQLIGGVLARRGMLPQGDGMGQSNMLAPTGAAPVGNALAATAPGMPGSSANDYEDLAMAGYAPAEKAWAIHKEAAQGSNFKPGETYVVNGRAFTVPQLDKGMQMGPNGVEAIPNYSNVAAGFAGGVKGAEIGATNANTPASNSMTSGGQVVPGVTLADQMAYRQGQGGAPAPQGAPAPAGLPPIPPQLQSQIDYLNTKGNPTEKASFVKAITTAIQNGNQPPAMKQAGIQHILEQLGQGAPAAGPSPALPTDLNHMTKEQSDRFMRTAELQFGAFRHGPGTAPQASAGLDTPTDIAVNQAKQMTGVELDKKAALDKMALGSTPQLDYASAASKALQTKAEHVGAQLSESQNLLQRIGESREALTKFQAGGGMDTKVELAKYAQALHMPDMIVNKLAGGDLAAAQEFQKYAAQEALGTMQQALASDTGKGSQGNRVAMQLFIKNNPNIDTDPHAIEKIFNFQTKLHNELLSKSDMLAKFVSDPSTVKDPLVFDNMYAKHQLATGNVKAQMVQGQAKGTTPAVPANVQSLLDKYK